MSTAMNFPIIYNELRNELIRRKILKNDEKLSIQEMVYLCGKGFYHRIASKFSDKSPAWSEFDENKVRESLKSKGII